MFQWFIQVDQNNFKNYGKYSWITRRERQNFDFVTLFNVVEYFQFLIHDARVIIFLFNQGMTLSWLYRLKYTIFLLLIILNKFLRVHFLWLLDCVTYHMGYFWYLLEYFHSIILIISIYELILWPKMRKHSALPVNWHENLKTAYDYVARSRAARVRPGRCRRLCRTFTIY